MNIIIRTDASVHIGGGHIMRCLVLAKELAKKGHKVRFAMRPQAGDFIDNVEHEGFQVIDLVQSDKMLQPKSSSDYEAWLQVTWWHDANNFLEKIVEVDLVIVDHYGITKAWESKVSAHLRCKILVIDDLVREHSCDMILDQTLGRNPSEYSILNLATRVLTGSEFALLAEDFMESNRLGKKCTAPDGEYKVLVSMGAVDGVSSTIKVLEALDTIKTANIFVTVLSSKKSPSYSGVKQFCKKRKCFTHIEFSSRMAELMLHHNIAIGTPGTTSWERSCVGLPSIMIPIADNQNEIACNIEKAGAGIVLSLGNINTDFKEKFFELIHNWQNYHEASLKITDGEGARRVVRRIEEMFG